MGNNTSSFTDSDQNPAETVNWYNAVDFCNKLSELGGLTSCYLINESDVKCNFNANGYRLPTEAEWEYAARSGGREDRKWSGTNSENNLENYALYYGTNPLPVATKQPNDLGIYDMSGNVWEWCWDWYDTSFYSSSTNSNPIGPMQGIRRVARGGSGIVNTGAEYCRTANRSGSYPSNAVKYLGFRISRSR